MHSGKRALSFACLVVGTVVAGSPGGDALAQDVDFPRFDGLLGATAPDPALAELLPKVSLKRAYLPSAVDLAPLMPPPVKQQLGSCVAHAVGYATRGYYAAIEHGSKPGDEVNTPSPAFLHSQIAGWVPDKPRQPNTETCRTSGSNALLAMLYMVDNGSLTRQEVPIDRICQPDVTSMSVGKNQYSIKDGQIIFVLKDESANDRDIDKIKQSVAAGNPVVIGMIMYRYFADPEKKTATLEALKAGEIYRGSLGEQHGKMDMGHELVVVGYDDGRQAFKVQNSWGTDWAEGGFGWIAYDALKADLAEALTMDAGVTPPRPAPLRPKRENPNIADGGQCALVFQTSAQGGASYDGFVESEAELAELRKQYGKDAVKDVAVRPWPVCEALLTLDGPLGAPSRPTISVDGGDKVKFGEVLGFSVTTPDFPSFLYVVYLQADGTVVNLVPRRGPIRKQFGPRSVLKFGDGKEGRQKFRVGAPAGAETIVAIAARSPLAQLEALETGGNGQFRMQVSQHDAPGEKNPQDRLYLSFLRATLSERPDQQQAARDVSADVLHVTVSAN